MRPLPIKVKDMTLEQKREYGRIHQKKYRASHPEVLAKAQKKYRESHREVLATKQREYNKNHRAHVNAASRRWRKANPEKVKTMNHQWYENNKARAAVLSSNYRKTHHVDIYKRRNEKITRDIVTTLSPEIQEIFNKVRFNGVIKVGKV